jgi:hypothetical protein
MASIVDLYIDQGSDFYAELVLENEDRNIIDLTGFEIYSQFRKSPGTPTYYTFETDIVDQPALGKISLSLPGMVSTNIKPGRYLYDVEIVDSINNIRLRVVEGVVIVTPEITRI